MKDNIHSKEAWINSKHKPIFKRKQSSDEYRDRIDKDNLSWENRKLVNELKDGDFKDLENNLKEVWDL